MIDIILSNNYIFLIILMIIAAIPVGFCAGLFGIGGGLISVPFLFFIFDTVIIDKEYLMHLSVGTAFSITIMTSSASVLTHRKHDAVDFNLLKTFGLFVGIGVIFGTLLASFLNTKTLVLFFSLIVYFFGAYLLIIQENKKKIKRKFNSLAKVILCFFSGFISAPMGITGAMINVPILKYFGYSIKRAIGTAASIGFIISLFGAVGFFTSGTLMKVNLPLSIGFINIPAFLIFVPITTIMARVGANTVHSMDKIKIQRFFGIFLYIIGTIFVYRFLNL